MRNPAHCTGSVWSSSRPTSIRSSGFQPLREARQRIAAGALQNGLQKINVELIVFADEAESVVAELNASLDRLEENHTIFGGGIEAVPVDHRETRRRTALMHTVAAGETAVDARRAEGNYLDRHLLAEDYRNPATIEVEEQEV